MAPSMRRSRTAAGGRWLSLRQTPKGGSMLGKSTARARQRKAPREIIGYVMEPDQDHEIAQNFQQARANVSRLVGECKTRPVGSTRLAEQRGRHFGQGSISRPSGFRHVFPDTRSRSRPTLRKKEGNRRGRHAGIDWHNPRSQKPLRTPDPGSPFLRNAPWSSRPDPTGLPAPRDMTGQPAQANVEDVKGSLSPAHRLRCRIPDLPGRSGFLFEERGQEPFGGIQHPEEREPCRTRQP